MCTFIDFGIYTDGAFNVFVTVSAERVGPRCWLSSCCNGWQSANDDNNVAGYILPGEAVAAMMTWASQTDVFTVVYLIQLIDCGCIDCTVFNLAHCRCSDYSVFNPADCTYIDCSVFIQVIAYVFTMECLIQLISSELNVESLIYLIANLFTVEYNPINCAYNHKYLFCSAPAICYSFYKPSSSRSCTKE